MLLLGCFWTYETGISSGLPLTLEQGFSVSVESLSTLKGGGRDYWQYFFQKKPLYGRRPVSPSPAQNQKSQQRLAS